MKKYLSVIPLFFLLCFVVSCQDKAATAELEKYKAQASVEEQNKALAMRSLDATQKGDVAALREIYSPGYIGHFRGGTLTLDGLVENTKQTMAMFSDIVFIYEDVVAKGDKVIVRYIAKGTHTGEFAGMSATGKKIEITGISVSRVENGKIVEDWDNSDTLGIFEQVGFELKPKEEKKK